MDESEFWAIIDRSREGDADQEEALEDPESLADVPEAAEGDVEAEGLRYAVQEAYEATHGEEMELPPTGYQSDGPAGEEWDEAEVDRLYPRLAEKFG